MVQLRARHLVFLAVFVMSAVAHGLTAQQWPGLESFATQGQLPVGWQNSPGGVGSTLWNVDANGNYRPSAPAQGNFSPFRSGPYSLNWNDSVRAYPLSGVSALERGVLTPAVDLSFAPNPALAFWTLWDRVSAASTEHQMLVRVWNANHTVMLFSEAMPTAAGLTPWHNRTIPLDRNWGVVRIEFYYRCGTPSTEREAAGWFIDDVDITGLTPPAFGIAQANNLGTFVTASPLSVQLSTLNGVGPSQNWQVTAGNLPPGVGLGVNGAISGTSTDSGVYVFTVQVEDGSTPAQVASKSFTMRVDRHGGFFFPVENLPFTETFASDRGWVFSSGNATPQYGPSPGGFSNNSQGGWERGPTSQYASAASANPAHDTRDPASDATPGTQDNMVLGVVAGGPIPASVALNVWNWAYTPEVNVAGVREVDVSFQRWMNCYNTTVHQCRVEIWNPIAQTWINVWTMAAGQENSQQWTSFSGSTDFGAVPGSGATTRVRFGYMVTHASALTTFRGGGFTVDEVSIRKKPISGILRMLDFKVLTPTMVGSYPQLFVGNSYPMLILLENTSSQDIALDAYSTLQLYIAGGTPYPPVNVGNAVPAAATPWIIPPGIHYLTYDPANPPVNPGPERGHFDFVATNIAPQGSGVSVQLQMSLVGEEIGGQQRSVIANSSTVPSGHELIHVETPPALAILDNSPLPDATIGVAYQYALNAQNGTPPYVNWRITQGPPWMTMIGNDLEFTATLSDVPNPPQTFQVTIRVDDSAATPETAQKTFSVTVISGTPPLSINTPSQLSNAREGVPYQALTFNHSGGLAPRFWSNFVWLGPPAGNGTLAGMTFDLGLGQLSGTPAPGTQGGYAFNLTLSDSSVPTAQTVTRTFFLSVVPANDIVAITTPTQFNASGAPPLGLETAPYNNGSAFQFEAVGGFTGPPGSEYHWSVAQGQLPPGLVLDGNTGELSGITQTPGTYVFGLRAADGAFPPNSGTAVFTIYVDALVPTVLQIATVSTLPPGHEGNPYQHTLEGRHGVTPYTWSLKAGSVLPTGLSINPQTGQIGGLIFNGQAVPPSEDFTFTVVLEDSAPVPATAEKTFTLNVAAFQAGALAIVTPADLPQGGVFSSYNTIIRATGGNPANPVAPYAFALAVASTLPPGLVLDGNGTLYGTPTASGIFKFTIECYDGTTGLATREFELQVNGMPGGTDSSVEVQAGERRSELVPFWEACSLAGGGGGIALLAASWMAVLVVRRRRTTI